MLSALQLTTAQTHYNDNDYTGISVIEIIGIPKRCRTDTNTHCVYICPSTYSLYVYAHICVCCLYPHWKGKDSTKPWGNFELGPRVSIQQKEDRNNKHLGESEWQFCRMAYHWAREASVVDNQSRGCRKCTLREIGTIQRNANVNERACVESVCL